MFDLFFQPSSVEGIALFLLNGLVLAYMFTLRKKSAATWWLMMVFAGFTLHAFQQVLWSSLYPFSSRVGIVTYMLFSVANGVAFWALVNFAYRFLENPFPREAGIVRNVSFLLLAVFLLHELYIILTAEGSSVDLYLLSLFLFWAMIVLLRKRYHSRRLEDTKRQQRIARAYLFYALLIAVMVTFLSYIMVITTFDISIPDWLGSLFTGMMFIFYFSLAIVYLNYSPEPVSFQAKLIGLSLVTVLALLTITTNLLYPDGRVEEAEAEQVGLDGLRFIPDDSGGYAISVHPPRYDSTDLGMNLHLGDEGSAFIALGMDFPFSGQHWDSLTVSANGAVVFDTSVDSLTMRYDAFIYDQVPKILPYLTDLDPSSGGGVYFRNTPDRAVISWHNIPSFRYSDEIFRFQLVLFKTGAIEFAYDTLGTKGSGIRRGVIPHAVTFDPFAASDVTPELPDRLAPESAWIDNRRLQYLAGAHEEMKILVWLLLGSTLFILVIFPFFFRESLIRPLERLRLGVSRVNEGNLDLEIPVEVQDEIGYLTNHFNRMTGSLRRYRDEMEELVAGRTAELENSLHQLQTAQAQLVQQEKLASLGQLTAGIAHEIKNPLNFVNNFADVSGELITEIREELKGTSSAVDRPVSPSPDAVIDTPTPLKPGDADMEAEEIRPLIAQLLDDIEQNIAKISEHGRRADSIVHGMLMHSRGKSGEQKATDINRLVEEYTDLSYHGMRAKDQNFNVDVQKSFDPSTGELDVVPQDLSRALLNIIGNGMYAANQRARSAPKGFEPTVNISTRKTGGGVEIVIYDNGGGISDKVRDRIFEPFFTTKEAGEGTGLGLSMSHEIIVDQHGGSIEVDVEEGESTRFRIILPA